jgi:hypothetical protein
MSAELEGRDHESRRLTIRKREYAARRRRQAISVIPVGLLGASLALSGGGLFGLDQAAVSIVVGAVVLGFFGFSLGNWRCPECSAYLGQRLNPRQCRACGSELRD